MRLVRVILRHLTEYGKEIGLLLFVNRALHEIDYRLGIEGDSGRQPERSARKSIHVVRACVGKRLGAEGPHKLRKVFEEFTWMRKQPAHYRVRTKREAQ